jgi:type VI protein secretion system component VasK
MKTKRADHKTSTTDLTPQLAALTQLRDEIREELRAGHELLKDLRAEIKQAREIGPELVTTMLERQVEQELAKLAVATNEQMQLSVEKVNREFAKLADLLMGVTKEDSAGGLPTLPQIIRMAASQRLLITPTPHLKTIDG